MERLRLREPDWGGVAYVRPSVRILGAEFGRDEIRHVLAAGLALTVIFAAAFAVRRGSIASPAFPAVFAVYLPLAFVAAFPPFFLSLVLQKRIAIKEGCTTEFRILPQWLMISVVFAFLLGFVFAAPGSVSRFGNLTRQGAGKMSAAVPLSFIGVGAASLAALLVMILSPGAAVAAGPWVLLLLLVVAEVNAIMAAFAMLPVPGFAGMDIWRWSKVFYAALLAAAVALYWASVVVIPH